MPPVLVPALTYPTNRERSPAPGVSLTSPPLPHKQMPAWNTLLSRGKPRKEEGMKQTTYSSFTTRRLACAFMCSAVLRTTAASRRASRGVST